MRIHLQYFEYMKPSFEIWKRWTKGEFTPSTSVFMSYETEAWAMLVKCKNRAVSSEIKYMILEGNIRRYSIRNTTFRGVWKFHLAYMHIESLKPFVLPRTSPAMLIGFHNYFLSVSFDSSSRRHARLTVGKLFQQPTIFTDNFPEKN